MLLLQYRKSHRPCSDITNYWIMEWLTLTAHGDYFYFMQRCTNRGDSYATNLLDAIIVVVIIITSHDCYWFNFICTRGRSRKNINNYSKILVIAVIYNEWCMAMSMSTPYFLWLNYFHLQRDASCFWPENDVNKYTNI